MSKRKCRKYFADKSDFIKAWSLREFRKPNVQKILIACDVCYPKRKEVPVRKTGQIFFLESEA